VTSKAYGFFIKMAYVYKHTRLDTNEVFYIGIGNDLEYKRAYDVRNGRNAHWKRVINKTEYTVEIIEDCIDREIACEREKYWINFYGRRDLNEGTLVNMTDGGDGGDTITGHPNRIEILKKKSDSAKGRVVSDEIRLKISKAHKGISMIDKYGEERALEMKRKMAEASTGRIISEETRRKLSEASKNISEKTRSKLSEASKLWHSNNECPMTGKTHSDETKQKMSDSHKGYIKSEEHRKHLSESRIGMKFSDQHIQKLKESHTGKTASEETKRKMSESQKNRYKK